MILAGMSNVAFAGDIKPAGTILIQDSYVFTIDEAEKLKIYVDELEQNVKKQDLEIKEYEKLDVIFKDKEKSYKEIVDIKDQQISQYKELHILDTSRVDKLQRHENTAKYERFGFFILGIAVTTSSIIIADNVNDYIRAN
jgi:hypothetical protein